MEGNRLDIVRSIFAVRLGRRLRFVQRLGYVHREQPRLSEVNPLELHNGLNNFQVRLNYVLNCNSVKKL